MMTRDHVLARAATALAMAVLLAACSGGGSYDSFETMDREQREREEAGSILGQGGLTSVFNLGGGGQETPAQPSDGLAVNGYLWRGALDTVAFMPLSQVDPFGGVVITDWYSPPETSDARFRLTVYILSRELRSDGVRVAVFREVRDGAGGWRTASVNPDTAVRLENAILERARALRVSLEKPREADN